MAPNTTTTTLYQHPDGGSIWMTSDGRIVLSEPWDNDEEDCAALPIGPLGLKLLGLRLLTLAAEMEVEGK